MDISWFYTTAAGFLLGLSALITAVGIIVKAAQWLHKYTTNRLKNMIGYKNIIERQNVMETKIDRILGELTHNGGSSTKDVVKAVSDSIVRLESRQQAMLDAISDGQGMFECTIFGDFVWVNKSLCYLIGRTPQDILGKGWIGSVAYKHRERLLDELDECIDQQRELQLKFNMVRLDGTEILVEMKTNKMSDHSGKNMGYFGTITRLEDEKLA